MALVERIGAAAARNRSQRAHHLLDGLSDISEIVGIGGGERVYVVGGAHGVVDHRPFSGREPQPQAHRLDRQE